MCDDDDDDIDEINIRNDKNDDDDEMLYIYHINIIDHYVFIFEVDEYEVETDDNHIYVIHVVVFELIDDVPLFVDWREQVEVDVDDDLIVINLVHDNVDDDEVDELDDVDVDEL